jgi:hypothetical protein
MPAYVTKGLTRFTTGTELKGASSPGIYVSPAMGVRILQRIAPVKFLDSIIYIFS